jgi:hypothetical protein
MVSVANVLSPNYCESALRAAAACTAKPPPATPEVYGLPVILSCTILAGMPSTGRASRALSLDDLAAMDPDALMDLYKSAKTPRLEDLDGKLSGRMLAVPRLQKPHVRAWIEKFSRSPLFPWQGKTFEHETAEHGHGINRLLGERLTWFRFDTSVGRSHAGDFDAVHLDYGHQGNPPLVRKVKDEVREVAPGLWLGLAYLTMRDGEHLGCFFGIARATT